MTSRERIKTIFTGGVPDRCGFWMGNPLGDTWQNYFEYFGTSNQEEVRRHLDDDIRWICADFAYKHPEGKPLFEMTRDGKPIFADCEDVVEIEDYPDWPNLDYLDFTQPLDDLRSAGDVCRASGMWASFFHILAGYFGMENYFIKMYLNPDVVDAVTRKVCEFFLESNRRFFEVAGDEMDVFFFGNDYGTQLDLLVSPEQWDRFMLPYTKALVDLGHKYGYKVMHHSCGAVHKIIPKYIEMGVDALHPLQARASNMDAETLARDFKGKIAFVGGIDTQHLLVHGSPEDVKAEVRRVKALLGPNLVISPSHEALLPNVPAQNVVAMAEAAREM
ncbi:MAG: uroporphyrinogen decarboxylase family protein [Armatimonadota bacterium]